ncbi:MAG: (d)CMP kinase, partial [Lachnospiraceae bacterium]|nr:(d)CMP kinase [Lachnospiraceae bacterium]
KVLPYARKKIYLTASTAVRARRRFDELMARGESAKLDEIEKEIRDRDHRDMTREESPLMQAEDAILVDTSDMTIDEVVEKILGLLD